MLKTKKSNIKQKNLAFFGRKISSLKKKTLFVGQKRLPNFFLEMLASHNKTKPNSGPKLVQAPHHWEAPT